MCSNVSNVPVDENRIVFTLLLHLVNNQLFCLADINNLVIVFPLSLIRSTIVGKIKDRVGVALGHMPWVYREKNKGLAQKREEHQCLG